MKQKKKYFVLNKESDFLKGVGNGICMGSGAITLEKGRIKGTYFTKVFDSREKQTIWHRMQLEGTFCREESIEISVYACESLSMVIGKNTILVEKLLQDSEIVLEEKEKYMECCKCAVVYNPKDILLHQVKGRYLWLKITLVSQGEQVPFISRIQIYFPKDTWLKYLPEVYEENKESASFLERYLSIFQSVYEDMTKRIEEVPALLNPWTAKFSSLIWLSQWLSLENIDLWNEEQIRYLISNAVMLYKYRGTVQYLKEILKLYTGKEPYIIERHQLEVFFDGSSAGEDLKRLYSSYSFEFTVLLDAEGMESNNRNNILKQLVDMAKPANMECRIVTLKPYIFLGQYSYIGINSVLGRYKAFQLDGLCAVPFSAIANE